LTKRKSSTAISVYKAFRTADFASARLREKNPGGEPTMQVYT
jgi:hypothetical protein